MADQVIENLITQLSFDYDEKKLVKSFKQINGITKALAGLVAAAGAAAIGMFAFAKSTAAVHDSLGKLSEITDVSLQSLQELGFVAEIHGGSIDSMNSSMLGLSTTISQAARGMGPGIEVFGMLGLSVLDAENKIKSADVVLEELSEKIIGLGTDAQRLEFTRKLGLDDSILRVLKSTRGTIKDLRKEAQALGFTVSREDTLAAADFNDEILRGQKLLIGIKNLIGTDLIKQFTPLIKKSNSWVKANKDLIKTKILVFLEKLQKIIVGVAVAGDRIIKIIGGVAHSMGGWENAIIAVSAALLAMNARALLMPVLAAASAVGLLLIIDELQKFAEGGDTILGDLADEFPNIDFLANALLDTLSLIAEGWKLIFTEGDSALEGLKLLIKDVYAPIKEYLIDPLTKVIELIEMIPGFNTGGQQSVVPTKEETKRMDDFLGIDREKIIKEGGVKFNKSFFERFIGEKGSFPERISPIGNILNKHNTTNNANKTTLNVTINESKDPDNTLDNVLKSANDNLGSQVEF